MRNKEDKFFVITIIILLIILAGILILKESSSINIKKDNAKQSEIVISKAELDSEMKKVSVLGINDINEVKESIFEKKIVEEECKKRNINLDTKQEEEFRDKAFKEELSNEDKEYAKKVQLNEEEMRQAIYDLSVEIQLKAELQDVLLYEINENKVTINNDEFKNKVNNYYERHNIHNNPLNYSVKELIQLSEEYFELIKKQYVKVEEIN
jgi:predicted MPP superfamily phosphohydrolase